MLFIICINDDDDSRGSHTSVQSVHVFLAYCVNNVIKMYNIVVVFFIFASSSSLDILAVNRASFILLFSHQQMREIATIIIVLSIFYTFTQ